MGGETLEQQLALKSSSLEADRTACQAWCTGIQQTPIKTTSSPSYFVLRWEFASEPLFLAVEILDSAFCLTWVWVCFRGLQWFTKPSRVVQWVRPEGTGELGKLQWLNRLPRPIFFSEGDICKHCLSDLIQIPFKRYICGEFPFP